MVFLQIVADTLTKIILERVDTIMSIQAHIDSLAEKRAQIKEQINTEMNHPSPNFELISKLKKQNLTLKEEMQRYLTALNEKELASS